MIENDSKRGQVVVFRTPEGKLVWNPLEGSFLDPRMIQEKEGQGNQVLAITSVEEAKKLVKQGSKEKET